VTILIIGGLLLLAVLAIAGAVLLGISEQRSQPSRANARATSSPTNPTPAPSQAPSVSRAAEQTTPGRQGLPATIERPQRSTGDGQQLYALNGQFHELAAELRTLYQQAWDLERRLRGLMEMADRIEDKQDVEISVEEERYSQTPGSTLV
jgi:hypothetical protein